MEIQKPEELSVQELKEQLVIATQKELEAIANEILALEEKYLVGIGIQIDAKKLSDIINYMITSNKASISLKFEIWKNP
ncbi:MAG: hypothetical protein FD155_3378 [Bacteroidetes bacterium]|nr:MAG: hypothetical protein FD155_3378 [Bacteroidota bacterium]